MGECSLSLGVRPYLCPHLAPARVEKGSWYLFSLWNSTSYYEVSVALTERGPDVYLVHSARGERTGLLTSAACRIVREGAVTRYEVAIPLREAALIDPAGAWTHRGAKLPGSFARGLPQAAARTKAFGFSVLVNDNDGKGRKGWIEWGSGIGRGKDPARFQVCWIAR